jgi:hypothetical protein
MVTPVRAEPSSKRRIRTGVAISPTEVCAADIRLRGSTNGSWRARIEAPPADGSSWPSLVTAFTELAHSLGVTDGTMSISLMPPLTEVRRLDLPPLTDEDLQRLLGRNASRYFVNARTPQIVGASHPKRRPRGRSSPVVAAAASARLVASVRTAAEQSGWTVESVSPAESAWAGAAIALWPGFARQSSYALIAQDDRTDLLQIEDGRLIGVRRFRAGSADAAMIVDTVGPNARVGIAGDPEARRALAAALSPLGVAVAAPVGEWASVAEKSELLAAQFAGGDVGPTLRTEGAVAAEGAGGRQATWMFGGGAPAPFVGAAVINLLFRGWRGGSDHT